MSVASPPLAPAVEPPVIARQAILDGDKSVVGYELFNRSRSSAHQASGSVLAAFCAALDTRGDDDPHGTRPLFLGCTHECLVSEHLEVLPTHRMVLDVDPLPGHLVATEVSARLPTLQKLHARGFQLCFDHTVLETEYFAWLPLAHYIKLNMSVLQPEQVAVLVNFAQRSTQAQLIATKVESAAQFQLVHELGVSLYQGAWLSRPAPFEAKLLAPSQTSLLQLISLLRRQAHMDELEAVLKKDVGLAFNLLRLINSAGFSQQREITSFRQAVMIIGIKKLFRWAALLMAATQFGGNPPALGQTAIARARLMELLALRFMGEDEADMAFVTGLFSLLDAMLGMPIAQALELIYAPQPVVEALQQQRGTYYQLLRIAQACEPTSAPAQTANGFAHALPLSAEEINQSHLRTLDWCDMLAV